MGRQVWTFWADAALGVLVQQVLLGVIPHRSGPFPSFPYWPAYGEPALCWDRWYPWPGLKSPMTLETSFFFCGFSPGPCVAD